MSFLVLTEFGGASSVSSSQPIICVPKRTHRVFFRRTHRDCRKTQWGSVSFLLRNSALETVFRPCPTRRHKKMICRVISGLLPEKPARAPAALFRERPRGGGKHAVNSAKNPSPKTFLDPHLRYVPPPFFGDSLSFPLEERGADQTHPNFWGLQKWFWRAHSAVRFPPPPNSRDTFCPPLSRCPSFPWDPDCLSN